MGRDWRGLRRTIFSEAFYALVDPLNATVFSIFEKI
jgi:hypothetical protein